jgi:hypothetical protein
MMTVRALFLRVQELSWSWTLGVRVPERVGPASGPRKEPCAGSVRSTNNLLSLSRFTKKENGERSDSFSTDLKDIPSDVSGRFR